MQPLTEMGFDSLMAVDLRMAAEEKLGVDIPLMSLAGGATLLDIAARVYKRIGLEDEPAEDASLTGDAAVDTLIARHVQGGIAEGADAEMLSEIRRRAEKTEDAAR